MVIAPQSREELSRLLAAASADGTQIREVNFRAFDRIVEHQAEDMTATVESGVTLAEFQRQLRKASQWVAIDPPGAEDLNIGDLLAYDLSGPRRFAFGTIREYVLGMKVALANGEIIKNGGKVVKNVAGYDLCKLFIGARHTLGVIVECSFKLRPLPAEERILESTFGSVDSLRAAARAILDSAAEPVILDAHNIYGVLTLVIGFAGAPEDVEYQWALVRGLAVWRDSSTEYVEEFARTVPRPEKVSVLPSKIFERLEQKQEQRFVARLGNGVIYHDGKPESRTMLPNAELAERVKKAYDPKCVFPSYSL